MGENEELGICDLTPVAHTKHAECRGWVPSKEAEGHAEAQTILADPRILGPGGAPTRATTFPESAAERKKFPVASGVLEYFPDALVAIAEVSYAGNDQHNPGLPLRWTRGKSADEADAMMRHCLQRGLRDTDGLRHSAKLAWRALALLQKEIEAEGK